MINKKANFTYITLIWFKDRGGDLWDVPSDSEQLLIVFDVTTVILASHKFTIHGQIFLLFLLWNNLSYWGPYLRIEFDCWASVWFTRNWWTFNSFLLHLCICLQALKLEFFVEDFRRLIWWEDLHRCSCQISRHPQIDIFPRRLDLCRRIEGLQILCLNDRVVSATLWDRFQLRWKVVFTLAEALNKLLFLNILSTLLDIELCRA